jgi:phosphatidylserine/phosphatidylglycerophosphate/cardiolipin synthase-like enzyme
MLAAIEGARRRVHLETYILRSDATGRRFLDALAQRARAGVEVRVLYDGFGSFGLTRGARTCQRGRRCWCSTLRALLAALRTRAAITARSSSWTARSPSRAG